MHVVFVYVTVPGEIEAREMAKTIVTDRLAACANISQPQTAVYHWDGKIEETNESVIIFKTRAELAPAVQARVLELHTADNPCVVVLPVAAGEKSYLDWILAETKP